MNPCLLSLPFELIIPIVESLDQKALFSLLRSCRTFYGITLPYLYRDVEFDYLYHGASHDGVSDSGCSTYFRKGTFLGIYNFSCRVLLEQSLAASVKSISARRPPALNKTPAASLSCINENVQEALQSICYDDHQGQALASWVFTWSASIQKRPDSEATLAVLLTHLPQLQRLEISLDTCKTTFCDWVLRLASKPVSRLPCTAF